jgi:tRNA threonylcarbamoyladenosine biosynthesis protein TsaE
MPLDVIPHRPILESRDGRWRDESDCQAQSRALADGLRRLPAEAGVSIELHGTLGAGKTTFVRHLLRALGVQGRIKSPTFAVMEPYTVNGLSIAHFDFYRFSDPREWEDAGFRDVFAAPGVKLSEWPEKAAGVLPPPDLSLNLQALDELQRDVRVEAFSPTGVALMEAFR